MVIEFSKEECDIIENKRKQKELLKQEHPIKYFFTCILADKFGFIIVIIYTIILWSIIGIPYLLFKLFSWLNEIREKKYNERLEKNGVLRLPQFCLTTQIEDVPMERRAEFFKFKFPNGFEYF